MCMCLSLHFSAVGVVSLHIKTIERAHTPAKLWEVIPLGDSYKKALEIIDENMQYWPQKQIMKVKQRLTKIWQMLMRMRKLRTALRAKVIAVNKKVEQREYTRERKALVAAQVEKQIKKELLARLAQDTYGDIYNFAPEAFQEVMNETANTEQLEEEEYVEGEYDDMPGDLEAFDGEEDGEDADLWDEDNLMAGLSGSDSEEPVFGEDGAEEDLGESDDERLQPPKPKKAKTSELPAAKPKKPSKERRRPHLEIETETEPAQTSRVRH